MMEYKDDDQELDDIEDEILEEIITLSKWASSRRTSSSSLSATTSASSTSPASRSRARRSIQETEDDYDTAITTTITMTTADKAPKNTSNSEGADTSMHQGDSTTTPERSERPQHKKRITVDDEEGEEGPSSPVDDAPKPPKVFFFCLQSFSQDF